MIVCSDCYGCFSGDWKGYGGRRCWGWGGGFGRLGRGEEYVDYLYEWRRLGGRKKRFWKMLKAI